jgi:hypothetical protein
MENIDTAINQLSIDIEKTHEELAKAYDNNLSTRKYRKLLKELIELTQAKSRLEYRKENNIKEN